MDRLEDGRRLKCLTVVDDFTKESVEIARSMWCAFPQCPNGSGLAGLAGLRLDG